MVGGKYLEAHGAEKDLIYRLFQGLEETLEMAGMVLLMYAQLTLIQNRFGGFLFAIPGSEDSAGNNEPHLERPKTEGGVRR